MFFTFEVWIKGLVEIKNETSSSYWAQFIRPVAFVHRTQKHRTFNKTIGRSGRKMELTYLPDSITRYRYNPWHGYPDWEDINSHNKYSKKNAVPEPRDINRDEKNCSICQQNRMRSLSIYIQNKHRDCRASSSIKEETEDEREIKGEEKAKFNR